MEQEPVPFDNKPCAVQCYTQIVVFSYSYLCHMRHYFTFVWSMEFKICVTLCEIRFEKNLFYRMYMQLKLAAACISCWSDQNFHWS